MKTQWIPLKLALRFVRQYHRHLRELQGGIVALGLWIDDQLRGVVVIGRPARRDGKDVAVITGLCTDGCRNGCSKLYAKAKRLCQALGFVGIKTYTLTDESGASLFAVAAEADGWTKGGHWSREGRPRQIGNTERRRRWRL